MGASSIQFAPVGWRLLDVGGLEGVLFGVFVDVSVTLRLHTLE